MALPGMKSTLDYGADVRPKNYREGIMLTEPRNGASLYRLTAAMKDSKSIDDPEFKWYEEEVDLYSYTLLAAYAAGITTFNFVAGSKATRLKPGDTMINGTTLETIRIVSVVSDTQITVTRGFGQVGTPQGTDANMSINQKLFLVGSAYREGAPKPVGTSFGGDWVRNYTQIFRTPVEWTRTATKTKYRTGDEMAHDRRRAMHKHMLSIERSFWLGTPLETMESGQPLRTTGGILSFIHAGNKIPVAGGGGLLDLDEIEDWMTLIFAFGSSEKLAYGSIATIMAIHKAIRKNSEYTWVNGQKEHGMTVMKLITPAGTLVLTEHPAFANDFMTGQLFVLDTAQLGYRYITDTTKLKDRQNAGDDGMAEEWLTEAGLMVSRPKTHFQFTGIVGGKKDD